MLQPIIVKASQTKALLCAVVCLLFAGAALIRVGLGLPTGFGWALEPFCALFFGVSGIYLLGVAKFRPIALRMDQDGISGYYVPPLKWSEISEIDTYKEYVDGGPIYTKHVGIRASRTTALFQGLSRRAYDKAIRLENRTGFHILIPQMILKDFDAGDVVFHAGLYQEAGRQRAGQPNSPNAQ